MAKHINNWNDLQEYGINCLTGEACAYSMRLLCDLSEDGVDLMRILLGLQIARAPVDQFNANWNSTVGGKPAVASIMLPRGILHDLIRFILFSHEKCDYVIEKCGGQGFVGYTEADLVSYGKTAHDAAALYKGALWRNPKNPSALQGDRNVHQFSGRTT